MQDSLFLDSETPEANETLDEINAELLQRAVSLPQFKERIFIFGDGPVGAKIAVVGESPGPPDIEAASPSWGRRGRCSNASSQASASRAATAS